MQDNTIHTLIANSLEEMQTAANSFLANYPKGGHFALYGEMGAGKTTLIQCICKSLDLPFAGSPTFSLVNEYTLADGRKLYHFDLYRLNSIEELNSIGFQEYLDLGDYVFIEWPQIAAEYITEMRGLTITDNAGVRTIEF